MNKKGSRRGSRMKKAEAIMALRDQYVIRTTKKGAREKGTVRIDHIIDDNNGADVRPGQKGVRMTSRGKNPNCPVAVSLCDTPLFCLSAQDGERLSAASEAERQAVYDDLQVKFPEYALGGPKFGKDVPLTPAGSTSPVKTKDVDYKALYESASRQLVETLEENRKLRSRTNGTSETPFAQHSTVNA